MPTDPRLVPLAVTLLRVALGTMFVAHALLKLIDFTLPGTAAFFDSIGLPGWLAYPVFAAEAVGGVMLLLGIQSRWVALALFPVLVGATWAHIGNGWVFTGAGGGWEYPAYLTLLSVAQVMLGDGLWALSPSRPLPLPLLQRLVPAR